VPRPHLRALLIALALFVASPALATVNHGDVLGTSVDFLQVSETTQTGGDPEPLWGPPTLGGTGDQLLFFPPNFTALCASGGSDTTSSELTTTISAHPGGHIDNIMLAENGDVTLRKLPTAGSDATTNASAALTGTVTVTETVSGPITPVVIPFTGTFMPSSTFALPINVGTNTWSGSFTVNVSASVANATVAVLALDNDLAANCGTGNTTAKIQKKVVSGPAVAILVNPLACSLELDKTCCVTQPVLPDLDDCDGELEHIEFEYTGDDCSHTSNHQGGKCECYGHRRVDDDADIEVETSGVTSSHSSISKGQRFGLSHSSGKFGKTTRLKVSDGWWTRQHVKFDSSCERALKCGDHFGAFKVVSLDSTLRGHRECDEDPPAEEPECAPTGDAPGTPCDAKLVDMVLEYQGRACQNPLPNPQLGEATCSGDATGATNVGVVYAGKFAYAELVSPASGINDGDRIRVTSTLQSGGLFPNQKLIITDGTGVRQTVEFHVSCSKPLALGDEFGSFKIVEWTTKNGTRLALGSSDPGPYDACEVPLAPPGPHCTSDLESLTLVYIGDYLGAGCTVSNPQGGYGTCSGVADPGDPVSVSVASGLSASPTSLIEFGDLVTITANSGDLPDFTSLSVSGAGGGQSIQIKTSCWKPLSLGDRFGSFVVFGMDREEEGPISLGGNVQYQYKVTNPNTSTVDNVAVTDDHLGVIASGQSIPPGGSLTFVKPASLYGTTTNVAVATGDVAGDICEAGSDMVTVGVLAPMQGSFSCSQPINEITMIWNGAQPVHVKVWKGAAGAEFVHSFNHVQPGDAITASGLGSATVTTWEIYNDVATVKLAESKFDLTCYDTAMNGLDDCGENNGNLKYNYSSLNNDWLLEGMKDSNETLACTPGLVPNPPACGFGPELIVLMPGLMWLHRRRLRKEA